jgi:hypothetical protein
MTPKIRHHPSSQVTTGTESTHYSGLQVDIATRSKHCADSKVAIGHGSKDYSGSHVPICDGGIGNGRTDYPNSQVPSTRSIEVAAEQVIVEDENTNYPDSKVYVGNGSSDMLLVHAFILKLLKHDILECLVYQLA